MMYAAMVFCSMLAQEAGKPPKFDDVVEVTASRNAESVVDAPVAVTVVGQHEIATSAADNCADLLRPVTNVVVTSARDMGIRGRGATGVAEHRQLAMLDGRSIYLDFYGVILWDLLPVNMEEVNQIEILRGPGSALWGPNALAGVVNVMTRSPREMKGGSISLGAGEIGTRSASLRWAAGFERFAYKASVSYFEQDAWNRDDTLPSGRPVPAAYRFDNDGTKQPKADLRLDWGRDSGPTWSYKAGYAGTSGIFHSRLGPFGIGPGTHLTYGEVDRNSNQMDAKVYWNHLRGDAPNLINRLDFGFAMDTFAGEITGRRTVGTRHALVYGTNLRHTQFDLSLAPDGKPGSEAGVFVEDSTTLPGNVTLNAGLRADFFRSFGTRFSPRVSTLFKVRPSHTIRIAYNRAYRAPSFVDRYLRTAIPNSIDLAPSQPFVFLTRAFGNENLRAEQVDAVELGYTAVLRRGAVLTASVYRNEVTNNIIFVPTQFYSPADPPAGWPGPPSTVPPSLLPKTFSFVNVGRTRDQGIEMSWDMNWNDAFSTRTAYTYEFTPVIVNDSATPFQVNHPPHHQASLLGNFRRRSWDASLGATFTDHAFWADVLDARFWGTTESYVLVNTAVVAHARENADLLLRITNLLDHPVKQHTFGDIIRRKATVEVRYRF
jgi:outer membrane receptor protein involved in Fe transport